MMSGHKTRPDLQTKLIVQNRVKVNTTGEEQSNSAPVLVFKSFILPNWL